MTPANKRCQALVSMALPQGPDSDSPPTGDPKPSEGPAGPSCTPVSPAVARRRLLLQELEAQVQAAYGQVKWAGVWDCPHLRGPEANRGDPTPQLGPFRRGRGPAKAGESLDTRVGGGPATQSAAREGG